MGGIGKTVPPFEYEGGELLEGRKTNGRQLRGNCLSENRR